MVTHIPIHTTVFKTGLVCNGDVCLLIYRSIVHVILHIRVACGREEHAHHLLVHHKINSLRIEEELSMTILGVI